MVQNFAELHLHTIHYLLFISMWSYLILAKRPSSYSDVKKKSRAGPCRRARDAQGGHGGPASVATRGQGLRGLPPERPRPSDRGALLRAPPSRRPRLGAPGLGRGERRPVDRGPHHQDDPAQDGATEGRSAGRPAGCEAPLGRRLGPAPVAAGLGRSVTNTVTARDRASAPASERFRE